MIDLFYKSYANKMNIIKFVKIALLILFAVFIAVLPAVRAYASSVLIGALVGGLLGTAVGTALGAAGCTVIVAVLAGMCVSIGVSALYALFDDADFQTSFLQEWDNLTQQFQYRVVGATVLCSGAGFRALYNLVKTKIVDHFQESVSPELNGSCPLFNPSLIPGQSEIRGYANYINGNGANYIVTFDYSNTSSDTLTQSNSITGWNSSISLFRSGSQFWFFYDDSNYHIKFKGANFGGWDHKKRSTVCPYLLTSGDYTTLVWHQGVTVPSNNYFDGGLTACNSTSFTPYFTDNYDLSITATDVQLYTERVGYTSQYKVYYLDTNSVKHYYRVKLNDGTILDDFYNGFSTFFYYILCQECVLTDVTDNVNVGNSVGAVSSTVNRYYTESKDIYYNYYNQIAAAETAGTLATGTDEDVKISTASLANSIAGTETLADTTVVTDVQSAVETTAGETIAVSPSIMCMNGINLIRVTSGTIREKFPFAVVYVLRDSFNVFVATRETPVFTIPLRFNISNLVSIDEDFTVDLSDLNTVAAIARWGELGALGIALAILTKRMLF